MEEIDYTGKNLTVVPLEGRNSENFLKKFPMYRGVADQARSAKKMIPRFEVGVSSAAGIDKPRISSDGKVHVKKNDTGYTLDQWNALPDDERNDLVDDNGGLYSVPDRSYVEEDRSISSNAVGGDNGNGEGNPPGGNTGGTPPPAGSPGYVKPGGWGAGGWHEDWKVIPMRDDPGKWKVIDISDGKNVAVGFTSEAEANAWIDWYVAHPDVRPPGTVKDWTGSGGSSQGYPTSSGGGTPPPSGNGGVPPGTSTGTSYTQPDYIQTSGGTKWSTNPGEPSSWQVVPMTDAAHQGEFKVVDAEGKNVAG